MMNSRSTQLLIASALSIFLGLQFCHLTVLLQTSLIDTDATEYTVMSPDEINANERESKSELGDLNTPQVSRIELRERERKAQGCQGTLRQTTIVSSHCIGRFQTHRLPDIRRAKSSWQTTYR